MLSEGGRSLCYHVALNSYRNKFFRGRTMTTCAGARGRNSGMMKLHAAVKLRRA